MAKKTINLSTKIYTNKMKIESRLKLKKGILLNV